MFPLTGLVLDDPLATSRTSRFPHPTVDDEPCKNSRYIIPKEGAIYVNNVESSAVPTVTKNDMR